MSNAQRTETSKGQIKVDSVYVAPNQKDKTLTAQIRQKVTSKSYYPSKKVDSDLQDALYSASNLGFSEQVYVSDEERVAWVFVGLDATVESVQKDIDAAYKNGACIYRILSSAPILTDNQKAGVQLNYRTLDDYANAQVARKPAPDGEKGEIILSNGLPFYRRTFYKKTATPDKDERNASKSYISPEIAMELNGASFIEDQKM